MNAQSNLPAQSRDATPVDVLKANLTKRANDFKMVLPSHITVDKFQRTIATAALSNPQLLNCDRQSLLIAAMKLAQDGLLPDGREAALVPFKSWNKDTRETTWQVQAMPMAWGVRKKILQSGQVVSLETGLVYRAEMEGGHFIYEIGMDPPIRHRPKLDLTEEETADSEIVAAYSIARIKNENGDPYWSVEVMRRSEVDKVRQASQTGAVGRKTRDGKAITPKGPWVDWYGEMARKTVLRRHSKVLPMSGDLLDTFERDDAEDARARGAAMLLEAQEERPLTLPRGEELDGAAVQVDPAAVLIGNFDSATNIDDLRAIHSDWNADLFDDDQNDAIEASFFAACKRLNVDPDTGEVLQRDPRTGMTEVDEATARALDANDGTLSQDNPTAAEGPSDDQRGEAHSGADDNQPAYLADVRVLRTKLAAAKTVKAVEGIDRDWCNGLRDQVEAADDNLVRSIDRDIMNRKREVKAQGGEG